MITLHIIAIVLSLVASLAVVVSLYDLAITNDAHVMRESIKSFVTASLVDALAIAWIYQFLII